MIHVAPTETQCSAAQVAHLFLHHVIRLHGVPQRIISDRDPRFTSKFWQELHRLLGTSLAISTSEHPQTDGQTERANRILEEMLRAYVNYKTDDWDLWLDTAEFAYNNSVNAATQTTPFRLNYGRDPTMPSKINRSTKVAMAQEFATQMKNGIRMARDSLVKAQRSQATYADQRQRNISFEPGSKVLLSTENLMLPRTRKLSPRFIGPFNIKRRIGNTSYELDLPESMQIHPVFHSSVLQIFRENDPTLRQDSPEPPLPVTINGQPDTRLTKY